MYSKSIKPRLFHIIQCADHAHHPSAVTLSAIDIFITLLTEAGQEARWASSQSRRKSRNLFTGC